MEESTLHAQEQKARESFYKFVKLETVNDVDKGVVRILREIFAEAAKGNLYIHLVKLIELRAYGKHCPEDSWLEPSTRKALPGRQLVGTLNQFAKVVLVNIHLDRVPFFCKR